MKAAVVLSLAATAFATASDFRIEVTQGVNCERKTQKGDKVEMHYHGSLQSTGEKFDASYDRGRPLNFKIGAGQVIKGWDEGLLDMCIGEKRTLTIPPEMGYGTRGMGPIPGGSTLIFKTELVGIEGVAKPDKIEYKAGEAVESATEAAASAGEGVADMLKSAAAGAADAAKTMIADTDDVQGHEEL